MNTYPANLKKTKARVAIYALLDKQDNPLSPKEIHELLGNSDIWLSTIYRVLDQFEKEKTVLRFTDLDPHQSRYELDRHEHKHYAVCLSCHQRFDLQECPLIETVHVNTQGFVVVEHRVEVLGFCGDCAKKARQSVQ
jgi:Fur family transcriptional regulator, ferric uptake regulator